MVVDDDDDGDGDGDDRGEKMSYWTQFDCSRGV